jgi:hypothetical protein
MAAKPAIQVTPNEVFHHPDIVDDVAGILSFLY